ncbi:MAG: copper-binding protein [Bdellovibrionales bacterium]|nr:copper-binding protein [Ramlibacter sp.]
MKKLRFLLACTLLVSGATAWAQTDWVRGTVVKVDRAQKFITIDHDEINSNKISGGTKVKISAGAEDFNVKNPKLFKGVKAGDKIRFVAAVSGNVMVLTQLQVAP